MSDSLPPLTADQESLLAKLDFDKAPLMPAVVQSIDGRVLMVAFVNRESLELSLRTGETHFFSRSRQEIWHKGATSGNRQLIAHVETDCDADAILFTVTARGPACHTGANSCFDAGLDA